MIDQNGLIVIGGAMLSVVPLMGLAISPSWMTRGEYIFHGVWAAIALAIVAYGAASHFLSIGPLS